MDCKTFETDMLDELYGELDEPRSAALARHVAGCAGCKAAMDGLRATLRVAKIPPVDVPVGLEARVLAAAQAAMPVSTGRRVARSISIAGDWAMRPQTAMAAVFMVMLGTSLLLLRGKSSRAPASAEVRVTEQGTPAPVPVPPAAASVATGSGGLPEPSSAAPMPARRAAEAKGVVALADSKGAGALADSKTASAGGPAGAAAPLSAPVANGRGASERATADDAQEPSPLDAALRLYQSARYDAAAHAFDALSAGDPNADLWAARALRDGKGCRSAVARFDKVAQRAAGTAPGWDALLEGALCYRSIGDFGNARVRLNALLPIDSHKDRARAELDRMLQMQSRGGAFAEPPAGAAGRAQPATAAPPAAAPRP